MTDLSTVPTPDLVRELCSREGVCMFDVKSPEIFYDIHLELPEGETMIYPNCADEGYGPARIIVVRGE